MKKLRALALSDLHLGEEDGLLFDNKCEIIDKIVEKINALSQAAGDENCEDGIEELILLGDIVDLSEAKDEDAYENTKRLLGNLIDRVKIEKIVYIPGNHDHHMWVEALEEIQKKTDIDIPKLPTFIDQPLNFIQKCLPADPPKVVLHYPYYRICENNKCFLFDHGHLFSNTLKTLSKYPLIRCLFKFCQNTKAARDLRQLEQIAFNFMEWIWYPKETFSLNIREKLWHLYRRARLYLKFKPVRGNSFRMDSRPLYDDTLLDLIKWYLLDICKIDEDDFHKKDFHLVFGHTHIGGRILKDDRKFRMKAPFISVWNSGGWLVPSKIFSPDAYFFFIERTKDGLNPNAFKLVKRAQLKNGTTVGDYDENLLRERVKGNDP